MALVKLLAIYGLVFLPIILVGSYVSDRWPDATFLAAVIAFGVPTIVGIIATVLHYTKRRTPVG
jgi:hypothetical protein